MATGTARTDRLPPVHTLGEWRRGARGLLARRDPETASFESDHLARHVLGLSAADLVLHSRRVLTAAEKRRLSRLLHRRLDGVPFQYVLGTVEFAGITLRVRPGVFIPRPETEGLVEHVLGYLNRRDKENALPGAVIDLGVGSGAIALALAAAVPGLRVWGTDGSPAALRLARENARHLKLEDRVRFFHGDLVEPLPWGETRGVQVVVSNPPYISRQDRSRVDPGVLEHEPHRALFAGEGGVAVIRRIAGIAAPRLIPGGLLALEIGEDSGKQVRTLLAEGNSWTDIRIEDDLAGKNRYALAIRAKTSPSG